MDIFFSSAWLSYICSDVREGFDRRIGQAADDADDGVGGGGGARDLDREFPAAADDGERAGLARFAQASSSRPARGVQIARSPPSRRKATTCCTAGWSGKAAATSSMRSLSVPADENSVL